MSQLDQAKKEAKRLFHLAKSGTDSSTIQLSNLSRAREIVAIMNGYKNWHDYELVLKKKDIIFDKVDKNTQNRQIKDLIDNKQYFIQDIDFNKIIAPPQSFSDGVMRQDHKFIIMGHIKEKTLFDTKEKHWLLNQYPLFVTGATGAGKTEFLLSLCSQYIENKEGLIYFDGKGENVMYAKIFSYAQKNNRLNDLYCLNFLGRHHDVYGKQKSQTHTIDPINPMLGRDDYFHYFFGLEIGNLIHAILKHLHQNNQLMDIQSLESILMLNNLMQWQKNKFFDLPQLNDYLNSLGLSYDSDDDELEDALEKHALNCTTALKTVSLFKNHCDLFTVNPSVNMQDIFTQRKILIVLLPALEKCPENLAKMAELIIYQISYTQDLLSQYGHLQNIILDEFIYFSKPLKDIDFSSTRNNYIFGSQDLGYKDQESFHHLFSSTKTYVAMKGYEFHVPAKLKMDLIENLSEFPKNVFGGPKSLLDNMNQYLYAQKAGEATVFCLNEKALNQLNAINKDNKYYVQPIRCVYIPAPRPKEIWLTKHEPLFQSDKLSQLL